MATTMKSFEEKIIFYNSRMFTFRKIKVTVVATLKKLWQYLNSTILKFWKLRFL
jgi:tRNA G26 N,N-dimethylase Trm1